METPSIYVACLAAYNNAFLHGVWIDVLQDEDDIMAQISEMLKKSPIPNTQEFAIHDYQGFGNIKIEEYEAIETITEYALFIEKHGTLGAALLSEYSMDDAENLLENHFQGTFDSEIDFSKYLFDECYAHEVPEYLRYYFDFEAFARDLFINDYFSVNIDGQIHVFTYC